MNWKLIEVKIFALIEKSVKSVLGNAKEDWVLSKDLTERFPMFTADFLKKHGNLLPRERMTYYDDDGKELQTRWMYPANAIGEMIRKGQFRTAEGTMSAVAIYNKNNKLTVLHTA